MLAARKLPTKTAGRWQAVVGGSSTFDELPFLLVKEWAAADKISIYQLNNENELPTIAMGLTMATGEGPKGAAFLVVDFDKLKSAGLLVQKTPGETLHGGLDAQHYDVIVKKGGDLRKLVEVFLEADFRSTPPADVVSRTLIAFDAQEYDVPKIAAALKRQVVNDVAQRVCNSTMRLAETGDLIVVRSAT